MSDDCPLHPIFSTIVTHSSCWSLYLNGIPWIFHSSLVFYRFTLEPLGEGVYQEKTSWLEGVLTPKNTIDVWDIPWYTTRKRCITCIFSLTVLFCISCQQCQRAMTSISPRWHHNFPCLRTIHFPSSMAHSHFDRSTNERTAL